MSGLPQTDLRTNDPNRVGLIDAARTLLQRALPAELRDDRFDMSWELGVLDPATPVWSSIAYQRDTPVAVLIGQTDVDQNLTLEVLFDPGLDDPTGVLWAQLAAVDSSVRHGELAGAEHIDIWAKPVASFLPEAIERAGYVPYRGLHQMRSPLPLATPDARSIQTRAFTPADTEALRLVNNAAFAKHPSQGSQSPEQWLETISAPWFRPEGTRIYEAADGSIAGFCITKIHADIGAGEIYVIGLDPSVHGQGLGGPMTASGLSWLAQQGLTTAMLYVESNNEPAVRTYERLGFATVRTDRAWRREL